MSVAKDEDESKDAMLELSCAYHLNLVACKPSSVTARRCAEHPNCYMRSRQGVKSVGVWQALTTLHRTLGENPEAAARNMRMPVGLENLGATCFFNVVIQCLFANTTFRHHVFRFREEKAQDRREFVHEMADMFAHMQAGFRKAVSPKKLIDMMKLDPHYQQDALEFLRLFLTFLANELKACPLPSVAYLVEDQFEGRLLHCTTCNDCTWSTQTHTTFSEISVPVVPPDLLSSKVAQWIELEGPGFNFGSGWTSTGSPELVHAVSNGSVDLTWCLDRFFAPEVLNNSNKYFCGVCVQKNVAIRTVFMEKAPLVLNMQIMRFVYDVHTQTRIKLNTAVQLPPTIEFQLITTSGIGLSKTIFYDLSAIVHHFGPNTHAGHYIADIRDPVSGEWYSYNDQKVERLNNGPNLNSRSAYFVVYSRRDREIIPDPIMTPALKFTVEKSNEDFLKSISDYQVQRQRLDSFILKRKEEFKEVFDHIELPPLVNFPSEPFRIVPVEWLRLWCAGLSSNNTLVSSADGYDKANPGKIWNETLLCAHGNLDPFKRDSYLRISVRSWDILSKGSGFDVLLDCSSLCRICGTKKLEEDKERSRVAIESANEIAVRKGELSRFKDLARLRQFPQPSVPPANGHWFLIPEIWRAHWYKYCRGEMSVRPGKIPMNSLRCEHGKLLYSIFPVINQFKDKETPPTPIGVFCEVIPGEWNQLVALYGIEGEPIHLEVSPPQSSTPSGQKSKSKQIRTWGLCSLQTSIETCVECSNKPKKDLQRFFRRNIKIKEVDEKPEIPLEENSTLASASKEISRTTRSKVINHSSKAQLRIYAFDVDSFTTIAQLKQKLRSEMVRLGEPIERVDNFELFSKGISLSNFADDMSLNDAKISLDDDSLCVFTSIPVPTKHTSGTKSNPLSSDDERGFIGTELYKRVESINSEDNGDPSRNNINRAERSSEPTIVWYLKTPHHELKPSSVSEAISSDEMDGLKTMEISDDELLTFASGLLSPDVEFDIRMKNFHDSLIHASLPIFQTLLYTLQSLESSLCNEKIESSIRSTNSSDIIGTSSVSANKDSSAPPSTASKPPKSKKRKLPSQ